MLGGNKPQSGSKKKTVITLEKPILTLVAISLAFIAYGLAVAAIAKWWYNG